MLQDGITSQGMASKGKDEVGKTRWSATPKRDTSAPVKSMSAESADSRPLVSSNETRSDSGIK